MAVINKVIPEVTKSAGQFAKKELKGVIGKSIKLPEKKSPILQADKFLKETGIELSGKSKVGDEFMGEEFPKPLRKLLGNPDTIEFKAKHNKKGRFSILGFLAKKNGKTVSKGAVSLTDGGSENAVLKTQIVSGKNGSRMSGYSFVDCSKEIGAADIRLSQLKKGLGLDFKAGDAAVSHAEVGTSQVGNFLKASEIEGDMTKALSKDVNAAVEKAINAAKKMLTMP